MVINHVGVHIFKSENNVHWPPFYTRPVDGSTVVCLPKESGDMLEVDNMEQQITAHFGPVVSYQARECAL